MERPLILILALLALLLGCTAAITRPGLYRLGQEGTPIASPGVSFSGSSRQGRWRPTPYRRDWERFQGRGPAGVK
ncbi:MAG: hypothetical protein ACKOXO_07065 [Cyanobium sp.]